MRHLHLQMYFLQMAKILPLNKSRQNDRKKSDLTERDAI